MAGTPLATLQILIEGDYSNLENSFNEAMSAASDAGDQISQAFNQPDTGDALTTAIINIGGAATAAVSPIQDLGEQAVALGESGDTVTSLSDAVTGVGDAATTAAPAIQDTSDSTGNLGESSQEAEGGLSELAEQLAAVGEALGILVADDDGVCVVPRREAAATLDQCAAREAKEAKVRERLKALGQ